MVRYFLLLLTIFLISGCTFTVTTPSDTPESVQTPNASPSTTAITKVPVPTLPIAPKLTPTDSVELVINLLTENGNCQFPCFLGQFVPGTTTQKSVNEFVDTFEDYSDDEINISIDPYSTDNNRRGLFITKLYSNTFITIVISFESQDGILSLISFNSHANLESGEIAFGVPEIEQITAYYSIDEILSKYGPPETTLIGTFTREPPLQAPYIPISLVLHYPEQGLLVEYIVEQIEQGDLFIGCPRDGANISLYLSNPRSKFEIVDYLGYYQGELLNELSVEGFLPIENATNFTEEEFYSTFSDSETMNTCIETESSLWAP